MDSPGPAPDSSATPPAAPTTPPAAPDSPSAPAAAATPAAPATPTPDPTPSRRTGLFGPRGPMTPEQQVRMARSRAKAFGFSFIALAVLLGWQIIPLFTSYAQAVEANGPGVKGGDLELHTMPADGGWVVTLRHYANDTVFYTTQTDANGTAVVRGLDHAVFALQATHGNDTVKGAVLAPEGKSTSVSLTTAQSNEKWLTGTPTLPSEIALQVEILLGALALALVGGACMILRKQRIVALAGAGAFAAAGLLLGLNIFGIAMVGLGVWAFMTIRKNPSIFASAQPA